MLERLKKLPDNIKNLLAIVLSIVIIIFVVVVLTILNQFLKQNLSSIRDLLS